MPKKRIVSVGYEIPGDDADYVEIASNASLLDADIILFRPELPYGYEGETYQGKPLFSEGGSQVFRAAAAHWRVQLQEAVSCGKTVVILLDSLEEVFVDTGNRSYSGTGRNARTTRIVQEANNYQMIPFRLGKIVKAEGNLFALAEGSNLITPICHELAGHIEYRVYVEAPEFQVLIHTRAGAKALGGRIKKNGTLILLPFINSDEDNFTTDKETGETEWKPEALAFGARLLASLVALDAACKSERNITAPPSWAQEAQYQFAVEAESERRVADLSQKIEDLHKEIMLEREGVEAHTSLRRLLYEKGESFAHAVRDALVLLGFQVTHVDDGTSEFDAVFSSEEGRFLGEFEGKDNKPLNIDKLSQLERNIQEDFQREEVKDYAKGVLFGNAHRLSEPAKRGEYFTEKVYSGAKRAGIALVRAPNLFEVARYLKEHSDPEFARVCRKAIASTFGAVVVFPSAPVDAKPEESVETLTNDKGPKAA